MPIDRDSIDENEDWDDEDDVVPCGNCGRDIYDDAERCPYCGEYISRENRRLTGKPWWMILGVLLCIIVVYGWIFG